MIVAEKPSTFQLEKIFLLKSFYTKMEDFKFSTKNLLLDVYKTMPILEKKAVEEKETAEQIINHFLYNVEDENQQGFIKQFQKDRDNLVESTNKIEEMIHEDEKNYQDMIASVNHIKQLNLFIKKIKNLANDIRVYSINSIIISSKSGEKGKGYSALSRFLIDYSNITNNLSNDILKDSKAVQEIFKNYENRLSKLNELELGSVQSVKTDITKNFVDLITSFKEFSHIFHNIFERVNDAKQILPLIIKEFQIQDIIEQQVEHIILSLKNIDPSVNKHLLNGNNIDMLKAGEYFDFCIKLADINIMQFETVVENITTLHDSLLSNLNNLSSTLADIHEDKQTILNFFIGIDDSIKTEEEKSVIDRLFGSTNDLLSDYLNKFELIKVDKGAIIQIGQELNEKIYTMESFFKKFTDFNKYLVHMNFLTKKEVKKWEIFDSADTSFTESTIDNLTDTINEVLENSYKTYQIAKESLNQNIIDFNGNFNKQKISLNEVIDISKNAKVSLTHTNEILKETLRNLDSFTLELKDESDKTLEKINNLPQIKEEISKIIDYLKTMKAEAFQNKQNILNQCGLKNLEVDQDEIEKIYDLYSIDTERSNIIKLFKFLDKKEKKISDFEIF